jgi:hypothetical protein
VETIPLESTGESLQGDAASGLPTQGSAIDGSERTPTSSANRPPVSGDRAVEEPPASPVLGQVGGPVSVAWREGTLTRVKELESLCRWMQQGQPSGTRDMLSAAVQSHLEAATQAAQAAKLNPKKRFRPFRNGSLRARAMSNLDAAEAQLLSFAPPEYLLGQIPSLLNHVRCHLIPTDPRRVEFERITQKLGVKDPDHPLLEHKEQEFEKKKQRVCEERIQIVSATRAASSAALREQERLRSFGNVLAVTTFLMTVLAVGIAVTGWFYPTLIPLCFAPQEGGTAVVVCPTAQSDPFTVSPPTGADAAPAGTPLVDIDDAITNTATPRDLIVVELVGLTAAAVAAASAIRGIKGSSERFGLPVALALFKLPLGAITAFLGLLLMRGQFVPGLTALDTSAQILAWALVFGYAQQLFTRMVDRQGQVVLDSVRGADKAQPVPTPP